MDRKKLIDTLDLLRPALAARDLVPIFTHFCFDDKRIYAFSDYLGIIAPLKTGMEVGLRGETILGLLNTTKTDEIEFETDEEGDEVIITFGKSRIQIPFLLKDEFLFEDPNSDEWEVNTKLTSDLIAGFNICLNTAGSDTAQPGHMGVTIIGNRLYSCDADSITRFIVNDMKNKSNKAYNIPKDFCSSLIKIIGKTNQTSGRLFLNDNWAVVELKNGYKVYGKVIKSDNPVDFEDELQQSIGPKPKYIAIPKGLKDALARAQVVSDPQTLITNISIIKNRMKIHTESGLGVVDDDLSFKGKQDKLSIAVGPELIIKAINICDEMTINENCTAYRNGDTILYLVGNL